MSKAIEATCVRGGTSKCIILNVGNVPSDTEERSRLLLAAFGSPDIRQIDGVGGATSLTSKACIVGPPSVPAADIDYTFGQVAVNEPVVDYRGTCGNCASAVALYAVVEGYVPISGDVTTVRIFNTNTGRLIVGEIPTPDGRVAEVGTLRIAGVPWPGPAIRLWFMDPGGSATERLLPTGIARDVIDGAKVSIVDAGAPVVFARASDLGLLGVELPPEVNSNAELLARLERIRGGAAVACGFVASAANASHESPSVPKVAWIGPPRDYTDLYGRLVRVGDVDFVARIMSMGRLHAAFAITGGIATATAATLNGTVAREHCGVDPDDDGVVTVRIGHPSGVMDVHVQWSDGSVRRAGVDRTARVIWRGEICLPAYAGFTS